MDQTPSALNKTIGIRVDVDFEIGLTKGVPFLLDYFSTQGIGASFYVTMGPDGFRHNRQRVKSHGYIKRLLAFNPLNIITKFGMSYLAKQFLGHPGNVGADHPEILRRISAEGHELGVHGYDHFWWAENIWISKADAIKREMEKGLGALKQTAGIEANVWASPNWRCSLASLQFVDRYGFPYGADSRGVSPFFPVIGDWRGSTIQLPITLPCLHEVRGYLDTADRQAIINDFVSHVTDTFNIWCIHDYYEGILERELFSMALKELISSGYRLVPIKELLNGIDPRSILSCEMIKHALPGGRGEISYQKTEPRA